MENQVKEIYTDGVGKIHFLGGTIRLDLFSFIPTDKEDEKPTPQITNRLIMSPNAFLASYESFVNMIDKLQTAGIIAKNENGETSVSNENENADAVTSETTIQTEEKTEAAEEKTKEK